MANDKLPDGLEISGPGLEGLRNAIKKLADQEVLVGIPEVNADRNAGEPITNAALGYIHEFGAPEQNIPARPFLYPGIRDEKERIAAGLKKVANAIADGARAEQVDKLLAQVGMIASSSVKKKINSGLEPALAESTLAARARRGRAGAAQELANRAAGLSPSTALAKPLVDTGALRNSITYVVSNRRKK